MKLLGLQLMTTLLWQYMMLATAAIDDTITANEDTTTNGDDTTTANKDRWSRRCSNRK